MCGFIAHKVYVTVSSSRCLLPVINQMNMGDFLLHQMSPPSMFSVMVGDFLLHQVSPPSMFSVTVGDFLLHQMNPPSMFSIMVGDFLLHQMSPPSMFSVTVGDFLLHQVSPPLHVQCYGGWFLATSGEPPPPCSVLWWVISCYIRWAPPSMFSVTVGDFLLHQMNLPFMFHVHVTLDNFLL